jgi:hypothetical protein
LHQHGDSVFTNINNHVKTRARYLQVDYVCIGSPKSSSVTHHNLHRRKLYFLENARASLESWQLKWRDNGNVRRERLLPELVALLELGDLLS